MGQFIRKMEKMSKNERESGSCVYDLNTIPSNQYNNIEYQPVCLEASEHQFIVTIMFSFPLLFSASQGEMSP